MGARRCPNHHQLGPAGTPGATGATGPAGTSGAAQADVAPLELTSSRSFTDLTTIGPSVTVSVPASGRVLVTVTAFLGGTASTATMSFTSTGGSGNVTASVARSVQAITPMRCSATYLVSGLSTGNHTFTATYRSGDGDIVRFGDRVILVIPMP